MSICFPSDLSGGKTPGLVIMKQLLKYLWTNVKYRKLIRAKRDSWARPASPEPARGQTAISPCLLLASSRSACIAFGWLDWKTQDWFKKRRHISAHQHSISTTKKQQQRKPIRQPTLCFSGGHWQMGWEGFNEKQISFNMDWYFTDEGLGVEKSTLTSLVSSIAFLFGWESPASVAPSVSPDSPEFALACSPRL